MPEKGHGTLPESDPDHAQLWLAIEDYRAASETREPDTLDTIILKVTNRCNEACKHCYDACGFDDADMDAGHMASLVEEALALSGPHLNLLFHGGEPFLRTDTLDEVATHARTVADRLGKTIGCFAQTNASVMNDRIVAMLQKHDFGLGISLDGWESLHDELRVMHDGSGTYRLFQRSMDRYGEYLVNNSGIMTTVMATNVKVLREVVRHVRDLGFVTWDATLFDLNGRGALFPQMEVTPQAYCAALDDLLDGIEEGEFDGIAIKPILRRLDNLLLAERLDMCLPGNNGCGAGSRLLSVSAEGTISGCDIIHNRALSLGQSPAATLEDALAHPAAGQMRERLSRNLAGCHSCTWLGQCGGTCLARGGLNAVDPLDCATSKFINEALLRRLAQSDALLDWYARFPPQRRRASVIQETRAFFSESRKVLETA
ncbi:radical SAM protein [Sagittula sp. S175]|uniref:radical SAM protein n=1 Tax=Sagittula sp. S175 TaxID=3415129 RepID=UPI003C7E2B56